MKFLACPPTSETLFCLIFFAGFVLCGSVYLYDSKYQTTVYPASIYGDDAVAKEIFRSGVGCINCGFVALALANKSTHVPLLQSFYVPVRTCTCIRSNVICCSNVLLLC